MSGAAGANRYDRYGAPTVEPCISAAAGSSAAAANASLMSSSGLMASRPAGTLGVRLVGLDNIVSFVPIKLLRDTINGVWVSGLGPEADVIVVGQEFVVAGVVVNPSYKETLK